MPLPDDHFSNRELPLCVDLDNTLLQARSEEHTSELQSPCNLVCRLLLEKKKLHVVDRVRQALWRLKHDPAHPHTALLQFTRPTSDLIVGPPGCLLHSLVQNPADRQYLVH